MKKLILLAAFSVTALLLKAQNTFPTSGNVGIGTTNPINGLLVVQGLVASQTSQTLSGNNDAFNLFAGGSGYFDGARHTILWSQSNLILGRFGTEYNQARGQVDFIWRDLYNNGASSLELARLTGGGRLGIGTLSPVSKLDVEGSTPTEYIRIQSNSSGSGGFLDMYSSASNGFNASTVGFNTNGNSLVFNIGGAEKFRVLNTGNVGIGTTQPDQKLTVNGTIHSTQVKVDLNVPGPDYVFKKNYNLPELSEVKNYIDKNHHLSEIPSAAQMQKNGVDLGEMNIKLLKKVEELTLYLIEKDKKDKQQTNYIKTLKQQVTTLLNKSRIKE